MEAIFVHRRVRITSFLLLFSLLSLSVALGFAALPGPATAAPRAICTWTGATDNNWGTATNWDCGNVPTTGDTVVINGSTTAAPTISGVSSATIATFQVINNASPTLTASAAATLNINGGGTGLQIDAGSSLTLGGASAIVVALASGTSGTVSGSVTAMGTITVSHRLTAFSASPLTFQNGATFTAGTYFSGNAFGSTNLNSVIFASGSTYISRAGSNPFGAGQPNSVVVFQSGSTYSHQSNLTPSFSGRTFANFELNYLGANISGTGGNPLSIDNLTVTSGTLNLGMTGQFNLKGNISVASGAMLNFSPSGAATLTLSGSSNQTISGSGTLTFAANESVAINNANGVTLQRDVTLSGPLVLTAGDLSTGVNTLTLVSTSVTGSGDVVGNVKRAGPFSTGTNYPFNNANTLINFGSITSAPGDITIALAKSAPVGLSNAIPRQYTVTPTSSGTFDASLRLGYKQSEASGLVEGALRPWKNDGTWTEQAGTPDAANHYVTATGVTSFSDWAIAQSQSEVPTNPSGSGAADPSSLVAGLPVSLTVTVTPGTKPASTLLGVTCDLAPIGGAAGQTFYDNGTNGDVTAGDNIFSYSAIVSNGTSAGAKSLGCTITDHEGRSGSTAIALNIIAVTPIGTVNGAVGDSDDAATHRSPYAPASGNGAGSTVVNVRGVIYETALQPKSGGGVYYGFFIQNTTATADGDPNTSDGLYVFMNTSPTITGPGGSTYTPTVGDEVVLSGSVSEYYNMTELQSPSLALLQKVRSGVDLDDEIAPFVANPPVSGADANRYWERRQAMRAQAPQNSIVLNGRSVFNPPDGEIWLARSDSTIAGRSDAFARRAFRDAHPLDDNFNASTWDGNGYRILMGSWGIKATAGDGQALITPARTFSTLTNAPVGGINYSFSKYRIEVTTQPTFTGGVDPAANNPPQTFDRSRNYSIVDYNLENLYDYRDNPFSGCDFASDSGCPKAGPFLAAVNPPYDYVPASDAAYQARLTDIANQIITDLHSPDILMLQEVENQDICTVSGGALNCGTTDNADGKPDVLQELALKIASLGGPAYDAAFDRDSSDLRGILPAFMYRTDRVQLRPAAGDPILGTTPSISYAGAGVAANANVSNPKTLNAELPGGVTPCETNWVFPRAPDIGLFRIYQTSIGVGGYRDVYVINNHFKSTPTDCVGHRTEQAKYNAAIVTFIQNANANARIVVGGDLNVYPRPDDPFAPIGQPTSTDQLGALYGSSLGLENLWDVLVAEHPESAYSYVYVGMAQTLDQMFVNQAMQADLQQFRIAHINSDFAADNPGDGARGTSDHDPNVAVFALPNGAPTLTSISPTSAQAGGPAFTLTLTGTNFISGSTAQWNGANLTTGFVSSTQLTATVPASNIANIGTVNVTVFTPEPEGGTSSPQTFTIGQTNASLHLTVSPSSVPAGQPITFTATLTQIYGASARARAPRDVTPSGIVTFTLDSTTSVTLTIGANGVATYTTNTLAVGPHTVTATYGSDANLVSATSETVPFLISSRKLFLPFTARGAGSGPSSR